MSAARRPVRFLASVTSAEEARLAVEGGADIIDAKDPSRGALGALAPMTVAAIRAAVPRPIPVSATVGDLPADAGVLIPAVLGMAASGADMVKVGFFPGGDARQAIAALGALLLGGRRLVGLLLADRDPDLSLIADMARAGFSTVMLDTAEKTSGSLVDVLSEARIAAFVEAAHAAGLAAGLAGALKAPDVARLLPAKPDVLGFRGALCAGGARTAGLNGPAIAAVRAAIPRMHHHVEGGLMTGDGAQ